VSHRAGPPFKRGKKTSVLTGHSLLNKQRRTGGVEPKPRLSLTKAKCEIVIEGRSSPISLSRKSEEKDMTNALCQVTKTKTRSQRWEGVCLVPRLFFFGTYPFSFVFDLTGLVPWGDLTVYVRRCRSMRLKTTILGKNEYGKRALGRSMFVVKD